MTTVRTISAQDFAKRDALSCLIVDVRTSAEHRAQRLSCPHMHIPLEALDPIDLTTQEGFDKHLPLYLICKGGRRASAAAQKLVGAGCTQTFVVEGGLDACISYGHAVVSDTKSPVMSLERQVQIGVGSIMLIGVLLTLMVHPLFIILCAFMGAGLIFAGITGWCGLACLLTKAPWNR